VVTEVEADPAAGLPGRRTEQARITRLLDDARAGRGGTLVVRGEPGIGKTSLLEWALASARDLRAVRLVGVESEQTLAHAGIHALVTEARRAGIAVPEPHAGVLRAATTGTGPTPTHLALGGAVTGLLAALAAGGSVLVAVDDAHWLDQESLRVLAFALRRLHDEPVAALLAARTHTVAWLDGAGFARIRVGGVGERVAARILGDHTAAEVARACVEATGGNPLALRQLAAVLDDEQRRGRRALPDVLPIAGRPVEVFATQVSALAPATQTALAVVAAASSADAVEIVAALAHRELGPAALAAAEAVGLVALSSTRVDLRHPLVRPGIAVAVGPSALRDAHRALAAVVGDPDRRAWHLEAALVGPDDAVADALDEVAAQAARRGAHAAAAAAWERAARVTTSAPARLRWLTAAAQERWDAAEPLAAAALAREVLDAAGSDAERVTATLVLARAAGWTESSTEAAALLAAEADRTEARDPAAAVSLLLHAALHAGLAGAARASHRHADRAVGLATTAGSPLDAAARSVRAMTARRAGDWPTAAGDAEVAALVVAAPIERLDSRTLSVLHAVALACLAADRFAQAEEACAVATRAAAHHSLPGAARFTSALAAELALRQGRLGAALVTPDLELDELVGFDEPNAFFGPAVLARALAALGRGDDARRHAGAALRTAQRLGMGTLEAWATTALAHLALAGRDHRGAAAHLRRVDELFAEVADPGELWYDADLVEALEGSGARAEAEVARARLAHRAESSGSRWAAGALLRATGILEADPGALAASADAFEALGAPIERARNLLLLGERHRDAPARSTAGAIFERIGASGWAARARTPGSGAPAVPASVAAALSQAELRVAAAVAEGLSNQEIALRLSLSPKTVSNHLSAIFPKLGVRSRTELALRVVSDGGLAPSDH
jgi:DNA-binding CsgD family transcriptional regulator